MASDSLQNDQQTYRRATSAAMVGGGVQLALAIGAALIAAWSASPAAGALAWHLFAGLPLWLVLVLIYNQHRLERVEALEAEQLAQSDARAAALFDEHADQLAVARRRLDNLYKWGLGVVSFVAGLYLVVVGSILLYRSYAAMQAGRLVDQAVGEVNLIGLTFLAVAVAFAAFIVGRYVAGMTQVRQWQLLRGGAGFLMGSALLALLAAVGAGVAATFGNRSVLAWMALIIPGVSALLGAEMLINLLLGVYRPRRPGDLPRPAFDSRLLGLLTSPESLAKALGEAINYQFGFEVSRSWFYQLLARAVTPLVLFGIIVLWLATSVVVVGPHQQAIVTRVGQISGGPRGPGLHFKLPYPFGTVERFDVGRVHQIEIGSAPRGLKEGAALLWTNPHVEEGSKEDFLVTAPTVTAGVRNLRGIEQADAVSIPGMSLIGGQVVVQYRISDLEQFVRHTQDPDQMLQRLAEREVNEYFVTHDIDALLGRGRLVAGEALRESIARRARSHALGLEVLFVGLSALHPPQDSEVAAEFHKVVAALQVQQTEIENARKTAIQTLASVAGSFEEARALEAAIDRYESADRSLARAQESGDAAAIEAAESAFAQQKSTLDALLASAQGEAAQLINEALAYRWRYALDRRAAAERFDAELRAYRQAPSLYRVRNYYQAVAEAMDKARKIVLTSSQTQDPIFRVDLKDTDTGIDSIMGQN